MLERWFRVCLNVPSDLADLLSGLVFDMGSCGLQVEDGADPWFVRLTAYFPSSEDRERVTVEIRKRLGELGALRSGPEARVEVEGVPDEDWGTAWRQMFRPLYPTPRIAVCPPWERVADPEGGFTVVIEPKMAFGTGRHETTQLALMALERYLKPGETVLDVGAGSGILSVAAARLGASRVRGVDVDPTAVENARENVALNGVAERVELVVGSAEDVMGVFDVVVANITTEVLIPMLPVLVARSRRRLIFGGVLNREEADFREAVVARGARAAGVLRAGEWVCVVAELAG